MDVGMQAEKERERRRSQSGKPRTWKLVVAYDGTDYRGWQVQPGLPTIQGELARAIFEVTGEQVLPQGSGRTDAGVHAEGQAVSIVLTAAVPPDRLRMALNRRLPSSIRVVIAEWASADFHARAQVVSKTYEYRVFPQQKRKNEERAEERVLLPWQARYAWECRFPLLLQEMRTAAHAVEGTFDFSSFAAFDPDRAERMELAKGTALAQDNVRTIFSSEWQQRDGLLLYRVCGSGFLYHMVRNLVGTFVEVGMGRRDAGSVPALIEHRDRSLAGPTAPPQGLFLMDVVYRETAVTPPGDPCPEVPA